MAVAAEQVAVELQQEGELAPKRRVIGRRAGKRQGVDVGTPSAESRTTARSPDHPLACVFHAHSATHSTGIRPLIPR
jgi:hypothetical protein